MGFIMVGARTAGVLARGGGGVNQRV